MRILYVINGFDPGGAEHGLMTLVDSGFFADHELKVLAFCQGRGRLASRMMDAVGTANVVVVSPGASLTVEACVAGATTLGRELRQWRPQMVILSLKQANVIGRLVSSFFPSIRCVSFEHISRYRARRAEWIYGSLLRLLSFRVDEIWADCSETLEDTRRYFSQRARRCRVVPLFKADETEPCKLDYRLHTPLRLAAAGRLVERKNFHLAIEAVGMLRARGLEVSLDIFGDGPDANRLRHAIDRQGLRESVTLAGYRQDWYREAIDHDIFVNLSDTEGFCIVVAEAMAAGLPVIATAVGGVREYGIDGQNVVTLKALDAATTRVSRRVAQRGRRRETPPRRARASRHDRAAFTRRDARAGPIDSRRPRHSPRKHELCERLKPHSSAPGCRRSPSISCRRS